MTRYALMLAMLVSGSIVSADASTTDAHAAPTAEATTTDAAEEVVAPTEEKTEEAAS